MTAFDRSMYLISPVDSLPLPSGEEEHHGDILVGDKFLADQKITFDNKTKSIVAGEHKTKAVMVLSCKVIYFMRKLELPSQLSAHPDCCLFYKSIKANKHIGADEEGGEPGKKVDKPSVVNNWICTKDKNRCIYTMLRIGKMIHHECHSAVKDIMHTKLANSPKVTEF